MDIIRGNLVWLLSGGMIAKPLQITRNKKLVFLAKRLIVKHGLGKSSALLLDGSGVAYKILLLMRPGKLVSLWENLLRI